MGEITNWDRACRIYRIPDDDPREVQPYFPSNGTDGYEFMANWCEFCIHDPYPDDPEDVQGTCPHIIDSLCGEAPEPWVRVNGYPLCQEFEADTNENWEDPRWQIYHAAKEAAGQLTVMTGETVTTVTEGN